MVKILSSIYDFSKSRGSQGKIHRGEQRDSRRQSCNLVIILNESGHYSVSKVHVLNHPYPTLLSVY